MTLNLNLVTGLDFSSLDQARAYYEEHQPTNSPPFSEEILPHLRYLTSYATWEDLIAARGNIDGHLDRAADPFRAVYGSDGLGDDCNQEQFDQLLANHRINLNHEPSEVNLAVWQAFITIMPRMRIATVNHQEDTADFVWSDLRCFFSGAGYPAWRHLVPRIVQAFPNCPFTPDETFEEWMEALTTAHGNCGWPVHLAWLPWDQVIYATGSVAPGNPAPKWLRMMAALHALKHLRQGPEMLYCFYRSQYNEILRKDLSTALGLRKAMANEVMTLLRTPTIRANDTLVRVASLALEQALKQINGRDLLGRAPLSTLPPNVLAGPWSRLVPAHLQPGEFIQHGLTLINVLVARDGTITEPEFDTDDILSYEWAYGPLTDSYEWNQFRLTVPDTYNADFPFNIFTRYFQHYVVPPGIDDTAMACIFDSVILASLLRSEVPRLRQEYPFVIFLPDNPTLDDSTSQGKTLAAHAYLRALQPAAQLVSAPETGSAPDNRAIAEGLREHGTVGLDEWKVVAQKQSILSSDNIQSLCTGMAVAVGRALENSTGVGLRHSIVASSKVTEFKPDLYNRAFPHFLGNLGGDADPAVVDHIADGHLSLELRLGGYGLVEQYDWVGDLQNRAGTGNRFSKHARICEILYRLRTGEDFDFTETFQQLTAYHQRHTELAQNSGLADVVRDDRTRVLTFNMLFTDLTANDLERVLSVLQTFEESTAGMPVSVFLRGYCDAVGQSLSQMYFQTVGDRPPSQRSIIHALEQNAMRILPEPGAVWALPNQHGLAGWRLRRTEAGIIMENL